MRQITTTVGPLAAASANNICVSQVPVAGAMYISGSLATSSFVGTGSVSRNILTITAVTSGAVSIGQRIASTSASQSVIDDMIVTGYLTGRGGIGTYTLNAFQPTNVPSSTIYGNSVAVLDVPRRILITMTGAEASRTFTIRGTNSSGMPQTELIAGTNAGSVYTNLDFKTVTSVSFNGLASGTITVGTTTVAASDWVRLDEWADSTVAIQCTVSGTVNYTLQQTLQDPNSPTNPVLPYAVTWLNSSDASAVNAITSLQTSYQYAPTFARILLNSGTGSVTAIFSQSGVVPY